LLPETRLSGLVDTGEGDRRWSLNGVAFDARAFFNLYTEPISMRCRADLDTLLGLRISHGTLQYRSWQSKDLT